MRREYVRATDAVFVISVAARLVGMHANTLRKYENEHLLRPARTDGNLRLYSGDDIARLRQIKALSEEHGVNVAGIRLALTVAEDIRQLRDEIARGGQTTAQSVVARLDRILEKLELTLEDERR